MSPTPAEVRRVLMCAPDHFDVVDVKNPHMQGRIGSVDRRLARTQWQALRAAFEAEHLPVATLPPVAGCEDMVFAANQTFPGVHPSGRRLCVLSRMTHPSRQREVPAYGAWFAAQGYEVIDPVPQSSRFEGCGDAFWHPGRHLIWAGCGPRTERSTHRILGELFDAPVRTVRLVDPLFYHLDTCLCALDERTALICRQAFDAEGLSLLRDGFEQLIEADEEEAITALAGNATALPNGAVLIEGRAVRTIDRLAQAGFRPIPVDTGEFLKSGGSVFCMKQFVY